METMASKQLIQDFFFIEDIKRKEGFNLINNNLLVAAILCKSKSSKILLQVYKRDAFV